MITVPVLSAMLLALLAYGLLKLPVGPKMSEVCRECNGEITEDGDCPNGHEKWWRPKNTDSNFVKAQKIIDWEYIGNPVKDIADEVVVLDVLRGLTALIRELIDKL